MQQDNNLKHTSHSAKDWLKKNKVNVLEWLSQNPDLNPIKMLWKDLTKQFIGGNPPTSQSLKGSALRNGLKFLHVIVQDWSALTSIFMQKFTGNFTFSYCSKRGSHQILKAKITYFCNAQICNTGSFFSINNDKENIYILTCLIRFSLSTFRTYMKIWWCFGSYLCRNIENNTGFTTFKQHCICLALRSNANVS